MADRVATARILVDGMTCSSCEQRIEKAVTALEGVRRAGASASLSEVMVYYEPHRRIYGPRGELGGSANGRRRRPGECTARQRGRCTDVPLPRPDRGHRG